jgi:hypothetical protein
MSETPVVPRRSSRQRRPPRRFEEIDSVQSRLEVVIETSPTITGRVHTSESSEGNSHILIVHVVLMSNIGMTVMRPQSPAINNHDIIYVEDSDDDAAIGEGKYMYTL